jgi:hypothetical protein
MHTIKKAPLWLRLIVVSCVLITFAFAMTVQAQDTDDFTPMEDHSEQMMAWAASPHGNTYSPGKGPNTYCSRCHSPQNWDPESRPGESPNCITCHFAHEEEMRIAETMDFVAEEDWVGIGCDTCHEVDGDMINATSNAWLNPISGEYIPVGTPNELCEMCHTNSTGVSETGGRGVDHLIVLGGSAHNNWAATIGDRRPDYCSDCHDPHTQQPATCVDCHGDMSESETHAGGGAVNTVHLDNISCIGCHDASGSDVAPHPDEEMGGTWTTVLSSMGRDGTMSTAAIVSHSIQWQVSCDRCHYEGNAWELEVLDAAGQPPEETSD